jgi:photosystem II stability/assembly factor-like uncharacterized protein
MTTANQDAGAPVWLVLGGEQGGTVLSAVIAADEPQTAFAASEVGVYRAQLKQSHARWQRLMDLPGAATALAVSPVFAQDHTLLVGTTVGPIVSFDGGDTFQMCRLPRTTTHVAALALSPNFLQDGTAFAGTLEDGILVSQDRGQSWAAWNFGLFELEIVSLALSPNFARDETVLIGTPGGLYYSYNGGRAWRELDFPSDAHPVLALACSPEEANRGLVYAGTESAGLYRATDPLGQRHALAPELAHFNGGMETSAPGTEQPEQWESLSGVLDASCINALAFAGSGTSPYAATEHGIFVAHHDARWQTAVDVPGALCLAISDTVCLAGVGYMGEPEITGLTVEHFPRKHPSGAT